MLFSSNDEEIGAILKRYNDAAEELEKNLLMMHIKSDGHLSLTDVYSMSYNMRKLYTECHNEFVEEQKKELNSNN